MICIFNGSKEKTNADIRFDRDDVFSAGKILGPIVFDISGYEVAFMP